LEIFPSKNYCHSVILQYNFLHRDNNLNLIAFERSWIFAVFVFMRIVFVRIERAGCGFYGSDAFVKNTNGSGAFVKDATGSGAF
jgi:hypothetical protein